MAQQVYIVRTDDLDGSSDAQPITFGFAGVTYEIDLAKNNAEALEAALIPYIAKARRVSGRKSSAKPNPSSTKNARIRVWAKTKGIRVSPRGRIAAHIVEQYDREN